MICRADQLPLVLAREDDIPAVVRLRHAAAMRLTLLQWCHTITRTLQDREGANHFARRISRLRVFIHRLDCRINPAEPQPTNRLDVLA